MIDEQVQAFLKDWEQAWSTLSPQSGPAERRAHFEVVAAGMREPDPAGLVTEEHYVDVPEQEQVRVRVFRIADAPLSAPALVYMHGGAWMQGSPETHWDITAGIAAANAQVVISVDYALAPEKTFPLALNECVAVMKWTREKAGVLGIDPQRIAIGGDSAGANLAAAVCLALRRSTHAPMAQLLVYPAVDMTRLDRDSHRENANGPVIAVAGMPKVNAMYCPDVAAQSQAFVSPLMANSHSDLPDAFIAVAQYDPLRDEGLAYAKALTESGVAVELDRGENLIHGYLRAKSYSAAARQSFDRMCSWLNQQNKVGVP